MENPAEYSVSIIGSGNVAYHLAHGLKKSGVKIDTIWSPNVLHRSELAASTGAKSVDSISEIVATSDFYIISVPDDKIAEVVEAMPAVNGVVVHTSGITPMSVISRRFQNCGVFYPLQTFSKLKSVDLKQVPFCVEGNSEVILLELENLAQKMSAKVYEVNSDERKKLHLAAVFVSNFVNHLYHVAGEIIDDSGLSFDLLVPLIEEVASKVKTLSPGQSQTGPARRNDKKTIAEHMKLLKEYPDYLKLYKLITNQIMNHYHE